MPPTWLEMLSQLLCEIYEAWGGNCADLNPTPAKRIGQVNNEYIEHGAPTFPNPEARAVFLQHLTDLSDLLDSPACSLTPEEVNTLRTLIKNLRTDIGF